MMQYVDTEYRENKCGGGISHVKHDVTGTAWFRMGMRENFSYTGMWQFVMSKWKII
jgi:hypothetical protein